MVELLSVGERGRSGARDLTWLWSPWNPAVRVASALDAVRRAPSILAAMRLRGDVIRLTAEAVDAGVSPEDLLEPILEAISDEGDGVTGLTAVHALARVPGASAATHLARLVFEGGQGYREHAAWAAIGREPTPWLIETMAGALPRGGMLGMHAQAALARWALRQPEQVAGALARWLGRVSDATARRYVVETIGLVPGRSARSVLERVATDDGEHDLVRGAAIGAFAERLDERLPQSIGRLASDSGPLGRAARAVRAQRRLARRGPRRAHVRRPGLRVAQLHLGAVLDAHVSQAGSGDTGGVATLLSRLGARLAAQPRISEVRTIGRGAPDHEPGSARVRGAHRFDAVPLEPGEGKAFGNGWPALVEVQRGIRAALLAGGVPDVLHLRMADPGSLAGALVAQELGIATVFTMAPDPHVHIEARERSGDLDRASFALHDSREALWFRVDLVEQLAAQAREVALFPRARLREDIGDLTGVDIAAGRPRFTVVAEGVDTSVADRAREAVSRGSKQDVLLDLDAAVARLPHRRHGLPLVMSVGRLHAVKGMAELVAAFAANRELAERANLVIVGGDLDDPSPVEAAELERIETVVRGHPELRDSVVLLGHRPNDDVALLLAAVRAGWGPRVGAGGAYACASRKEEFGLAIVEALAAGLPVVAPVAGGPSSYIRPGVTGILVDTLSRAAIARGVHQALDLATNPGTEQAAAATVRERYTIERMARTLAALYRLSCAPGGLHLPGVEAWAA